MFSQSMLLGSGYSGGYERNGCAVARDPAFAKEALDPLIHSHAEFPGLSLPNLDKMTFFGARKLWGAGAGRVFHSAGPHISCGMRVSKLSHGGV